MSKGTSEQPAAVIPAVRTGGSLASVRSLGRRGVHTIAVSEYDAPPSFDSRYCTETRQVPDPETNLQGYRNALLGLAARDDVETIVPVREVDVYVLAKYRSTFADHLQPLWPAFERLQAVHDRIELFERAQRADVPVPDTTLLDEVTDWDRESIVKGRHALLTADTVDELPAGHCRSPIKTLFLDPGVEPDVDAIVEEMGHVPIVQEYLDGTEYCFRALYCDGEPVLTSQKRLVRGYKYSRGPSVYHEAVDRPELEAVGRALLDELDWHGIASVGFIEDDAGTFRLLEVNPRVPASIPVDVHAGVDYPLQYWNLSRGVQTVPEPDYRSGTTSHLLRGELVHFHSVCREQYALAERPSIAGTAWQIGSSLIEQPRCDLFSVEDPAPFARDVLNSVRNLLPGR